MSSESRRSELNPIRSASVSARIVGSALHTTHSHHLSKSGLRSAGAAFADSPQVYAPLRARSRGKARRANEFALFPTQFPRLERRARSSADAWRSVNGGSYGDSKSLRRPAPPLPPCPMPSVRPDPANPRIASKRGSAPALSLGAAARSRWSVGLGGPQF